MADGKYRLEFPTGHEAFVDDGGLAVQISKDYAEKNTVVEVWEKDRSGWQKIYPD